MADEADHQAGADDVEAALQEARRVQRLLQRISDWEARQLEATKRAAKARREQAFESVSPSARRLLQTTRGTSNA